jgi:hypothetical protein
MTCRECGHSLPEAAVFCPECGVKIEAKAKAGVPGGQATAAGGAAGPRVNSSASRSASSGAGASMEALLARANLLRMRGQWAEAVERCTEALRLDPKSAAAHSLLGDIYENQGRLDKASHWYQLALEQNPDSIADQAKLARVRELQAVRRRTGDPRFSWAYLVAVAGVAFLFVTFVMAALVARDKGRAVTTELANQPLLEFPASTSPRVKPLFSTDAEEKLATHLIDELHSVFMSVTAVYLDPPGGETIVTVRLGDRQIPPDPKGGGQRGHILRDGYRIAYLARLSLQPRHDLRTVTIRGLCRLNRGGGLAPVEIVWQGRIDATRIILSDDQASPEEVRAVYDPARMYWNPAAGF